MGRGSKLAMYLGLKRDPEAPAPSRGDRVFSAYSIASIVVSLLVARAVTRSFGDVGEVREFGIYVAAAVIIHVSLVLFGMAAVHLWRSRRRRTP